MSALFYRAAIQVVLLFGLGSWVLTDAMMQAMDIPHVGFLSHITGKRANRQANGTYETLSAEEVLRSAGKN